MKNLLKLLLSVIILTLISCTTETIEDPIIESSELFDENFEGEFDAKDFEILEKHGRNFAFSRADVINPILDETVGKSKLIRGKRGIWARYRSNNLTPGYAYTLWWVIWNRPENCATPGACIDTDFANPDVEVEVLYASGRYVRRNGKATFYARLRVGDDSGSINDLFGLPPAGGLQKGNTFPTEVHLVLRSHGPGIPGMIREQISSYEGGCTDPFAIPPFTEIPDEEGECGDIEFSIHAPVN